MFHRKYNKPVSISEFSVVNWAEGSEQYLSDVIDLCNENQWGWMYFNLGGHKAFDVRYEGTISGKGGFSFQYKGKASARFKTLSNYYNKSNNADSPITHIDKVSSGEGPVSRTLH
jgi:hypothetical protein